MTVAVTRRQRYAAYLLYFDDVTSIGKRIARTMSAMPAVFLLLFFVLLTRHPRYAFASMLIAIVLLYRGRVKSATAQARRRVEEDVYSSQV